MLFSKASEDKAGVLGMELGVGAILSLGLQGKLCIDGALDLHEQQQNHSATKEPSFEQKLGSFGDELLLIVP